MKQMPASDSGSVRRVRRDLYLVPLSFIDVVLYVALRELTSFTAQSHPPQLHRTAADYSWLKSAGFLIAQQRQHPNSKNGQ